MTRMRPHAMVSEENIAFEPSLPSWKREALKRLGMGNVAKVPLGRRLAVLLEHPNMSKGTCTAS